MAKKIAWMIGGFFGLVVVAAAAIPLFVNVDKYRPQVVDAVNQQIQGRFELGKLSLSLWGQVRVEVGGLTLSDSSGHKILSVNDAYIHIPFTSVLSGSPELEFLMDKPQISVVKDKAGKLNLLSIVKTTPSVTASGSKTATPQTSSAGAGGKLSVPGIATTARMSITLKDAVASYQDATTGLESQTHLNMSIKDISLSRPTEILVHADLDTKMAKIFSVKGPLEVTGKISPTIKSGALDHLDIAADLSLENVDISAPGLFEKKAGVAAGASLAMTASPEEIKLQKAVARFFNAEVTVTADVTHLASTPMLVLTAKSNDIDLKPWVELIPMLKDYSLAGVAHLDADAQGPSDKLGYRAKFAVVGLTAKAPHLKAEPRIDVSMNVITDQLENFLLTLKAPGSDLKVQGKVVSFTHPKAEFQVSSTSLDLDQWIDFPQAPVAAGAPAANVAAAPQSAAAPAAKAEDVDALMEPLRENKELAQMAASIGFNLKSIKAKNVRITDMVGKLYFKDLTAGLDGFGMKVWNGTIKSSFSAQLKPKTPTYGFSAGVEGLDIQQAADSQFHLFRNTLLGKAHFNISGSGMSFNAKPAMGNLKAKGSFKVDQATFATVDVGKMVADGLNGAISRLGDKIPGAKGKTISAPPGGASKYDYISADFTIGGGKFSMPNFLTKAQSGQGIDLKGAVTVGLLDNSLNTDWEVIDTYNVTGAKDIAVSANGINVPHILAEGNGPVKFPVHADGTIFQPKYSYTQVPEALTKVAMANISASTTGAAKSQIKQKIQNALPQSVPQGLKDKLNGLFN